MSRISQLFLRPIPVEQRERVFLRVLAVHDRRRSRSKACGGLSAALTWTLS